MERDRLVGYVRAIGLSLARSVAEIVPGGVLVANAIEACRAEWVRQQAAAFRQHSLDQQQEILDGLAGMTPDRAVSICQDDIRATDLPDETKASLEAWVSAVPHAVRQATRRVNDGGMTQTLVSQLPRTEVEMARFVPLRPPRFRQGTPVEGQDYVLDGLLGQGGFGEVWRARNPFRPSQPPVVLKFCLDDTVRASLRREIDLLDKVSAAGEHPNIVRINHTFYNANPPFLSFEYVDGGDLGAWLAAFDGTPPSSDQVLDLLTKAARGLAFAHQRGVVHRDIKPANILVSAAGAVKIGDFGIGALTPKADGRLMRETGMTQLLGAATPLYTDPERRDEEPSAQEDVFSLGKIGIQLLLSDLSRDVPPSWEDELEEIGVDAAVIRVLKGCVRSRRNRYADGAALCAALAPLASVAEEPAAAPSAPEPAAPAPAMLEPGQVFRDHPDAPEMVVLPPGTFLMGAPPREAGSNDDERPQHEVTIGYRLAVGKYPVTFAEWAAAIAAGGEALHRPASGSVGFESRPVTNVS